MRYNVVLNTAQPWYTGTQKSIILLIIKICSLDSLPQSPKNLQLLDSNKHTVPLSDIPFLVVLL